MKLTKQTFFNIYLPVLLFLVAFCWKLYYIGVPYIWFDESGMIFNAEHSIGYILRLPSWNEPNPPLFMLLLHFWMKLFGISPYSVRIIPLIFNALTVVFIYFTGKKFFSLRSGILASGIFILSTFHFYFGIEARPYSMMSMATTASLYCFLSLINSYENKKFLIALVLANFILIYSHYFGWFVVFVEFLVSFMYLDNKKLFKTLIVAIMLTGGTFLPMAPSFIKQFFISSKGTWLLPHSNHEYFDKLCLLLNNIYVLIIIVIILLAGIINMLLVKSPKKMISRELIILFLWWFIPYTIMFLVSKKMPMFTDRYVLYNSIGLYLFIAAALDLMYNQRQLIVISQFILVLMFTQLNVNSRNINYSKLQNSVNFVKSKVNDNPLIIIYPGWFSTNFMYYYNQSIYKDFTHYDSLLLKNNIFPVNNLTEAKQKLEKNKNKHVIYVRGDLYYNKYNGIYNFLDSIYLRIGSNNDSLSFVINIFKSRKGIQLK